MSILEKYPINGTFLEQLGDDIRTEIEALYNEIKNGDEFEFMFFNYKKNKNRMGLENYRRMLEYLNIRSKSTNLKYETNITLDINYSVKEQNYNYRITIHGINNINKYIEKLHARRNHVIFSILVGSAEQDKNIKIIKKIKKRENTIDIDDFDVRLRLAQESDISKDELNLLKKLDERDMNSINFRLKQRGSLGLEDNKDVKLSIDLTKTRMSNKINKIENAIPNYELEIDLSVKTDNVNRKYLETMYKEINTLLKVFNQSNFIISKTVENEVLNQYANLLGVNKEKMISLDARKPQSLEVQHVVDQLPNKYAVTDKADGERYFLIIYENYVFLISDNLHVKNTGIKISEEKKVFNNTILDGELVLLPDKNRYLFMVFDCLYNSGKDIRQISSLLERLSNVNEIIDSCFILKGQKGLKNKEYDGDFNINKIIKFYSNQLDLYSNALYQDIDQEKRYPLIRRKFFIGATGGQDNEIFKYSELLWNKFIFNEKSQAPYILDGLIFHPLDQKYITSGKESRYVEYKWKPEEKNSIDFYIQFEKSRETGKVLILYDNSRDTTLTVDEEEPEDKIRNKPYKIAKLYVGKNVRGAEQPVLFEPETDSIRNLAYLYLQDGEVRDKQGKVLQDSTVVEFYYDNDPKIPDRERWVPMRTRYDKTEIVQRFGKKYGNYVDIAYKIWRSIRNPFTINDINVLTKDDMYNKQIGVLRGRINHSVILSERKENVYYQIRTTLAKPMRNFHNWIKSILIYTYVNQMYENGKKLIALDIACGRGGDLMRYYYGEVDYYVGIDIDYNGLASPIDGAISRYTQHRKTHPNFPRMFFIHADAGTALDYDEQVKALGPMSTQNKELMQRFFSKDENKRTKFDRISCQFAIHYFLANEIMWNNFLQNVNNYLKPGGFFLVTTFDADRIVDLLGDKSQFTSYYTNTQGEQKVLFEIVKKYSDEDVNKPDNTIGLGHAIDFHNAIDFQEGVYMTEYLVQKRFLENEFLTKCNMELIETDLFENQYIIHRDYFLNCIKYEDNEKTRKFLRDVQEYYTQKTDVNSSSYQMTRLYRFYVFRKKDSNVKDIPTKKTNSKEKNRKIIETDQLGGQLTPYDRMFIEAKDVLNPTRFVRRELNNDSFKNYSFLYSLHDILKNNEIIPQNIPMNEFYKDIEITPFKDGTIDLKKIDKLNKSLSINHDYSVSELAPETALNGLNFIIIKKECDGFCEIEKIGKNTGKIDYESPSTILYWDGNRYYPVYKLKTANGETNLNGLFNTRMRFIKELLKNATLVGGI